MASARPQGLALQAGTSMAAPALRPSAQRPRPSASASRPAQATVLRIRRAATAPKASPPGRSRPRGGALVCNAATATAEAVTQLIAFDGARGCEMKRFEGPDGRMHIVVTATGEVEDGLVLHWGIISTVKDGWQVPPLLPNNSRNYKNRAVQTDISRNSVDIALPEDAMAIEFLFKDERTNKWFSGANNSNFRFDVPPPSRPRAAAAAAPAAFSVSAPAAPAAPPPPPARQPPKSRLHALADESIPPEAQNFEMEAAFGRDGRLYARAGPAEGGTTRVVLVAETRAYNMDIAHWAVADSVTSTWRAPPQGWSSRPPRSEDGGGGSWNTWFAPRGDGLFMLELDVPQVGVGLIFVLAAAGNNWFRHGDRDFFVPLGSHRTSVAGGAVSAGGGGGALRAFAKEEAPPPRVAPAAPALQRLPAQPAPARKAPAAIVRKQWGFDGLASRSGALGQGRHDGGFNSGLADRVISSEPDAMRSLMHRFGKAADFLKDAQNDGEGGLVVVFTWLRFMALRQLVWNSNYNVKPREISAAQERLTGELARLHQERPDLRDIVRATMLTVGRGGTGDMGQRIRDEILDIQRRNNAMGGFMEEWHQKLHNNTTPDDVPICEGLLAMMANGLDVSQFWRRLAEDNIDRERLRSYDRPIHSEPKFSPSQVEGLTRDLTEYLRTLKAVHSGADLDSAVAAVLGYSQSQSKGRSVHVDPCPEVATPRLAEVLSCAMERARDPALIPALEAMIEARRELWPWTKPNGQPVPGGRLRDVIYLDLALEAAVRTAVEGQLSNIAKMPPAAVAAVTGLGLENLVVSAGNNEELVFCLKAWREVENDIRRKDKDWPLKAKSTADRVRSVLGDGSERFHRSLQPCAEYMGSRLNCRSDVIAIFSEEVVRSGAAAPLSQILRVLEPKIRELAHMGHWQIISPTEAVGRVALVPRLAEVVSVRFQEPTVIVTDRVTGDEDIPEGCVAVLTTDMPDVLSHVAVRARNEKTLFATCFDTTVFSGFKSMEGQVVKCTPSADGAELTVAKQEGASLAAAGKPGAGAAAAGAPHNLRIEKRQWIGRFALGSKEFEKASVGGKSRNLNGLRRTNLPDGVFLPASAALPFGTFDAILSHPANAEVAAEVARLSKSLAASTDLHELSLIRDVVRSHLRPPPELVLALEDALVQEGIMQTPWSAAHDVQGWEAAWTAITGVWASKWNERAFTACRKARLEHNDLSMAVLCQRVVPARYAFVIHTVNPISKDAGEIYCELVCGLGETLVGAYPGRALSFVSRKSAGGVGAPQVKGFPSKRSGLFLREDTLIFRSDSNGEDLEGFAGAGLYDSITMKPATEEPIDYSTDQIVTDEGFRSGVMRRIAEAGLAVEKALGSPQDIEGVVTPRGEIFIVQTRPQV